MSGFVNLLPALIKVAPLITSTVAAGVSAGTQVAVGRQQQEAAGQEAVLQEEQGRILREEAQVEAERSAKEKRKFLVKQKLAFIKNGVSLEGSPLLVLEETRSESQKEIDAIIRRGSAQQRLAFQRAVITRSKGRAALLGSISGATSNIFNTVSGVIDIFGTLKKPKLPKPQPEGILG